MGKKENKMGQPWSLEVSGMSVYMECNGHLIILNGKV